MHVDELDISPSTFAEVMRDIELNPHTILQAIEEHRHMMPSLAGRELRVSPSTKPSRRRSTCRRATCGTSICPTR